MCEGSDAHSFPTEKRTLMSRNEWTPEKIKNLRKLLELNKTEFGHVLYEGSTDDGVRSQVYKLEEGKTEPSSAVQRLLTLLRKDMVSAEEILNLVRERNQG